MKNSLRKHIKEILTLAIPVSIGQLGHIMMGMVDTLMVGPLGADTLAAASLANGLFFLIMVLGIGLSYAVTSLAAIYFGKKQYSKCGIVLQNALVVNLFFSFIFTLIIYFGADLTFHLGQPSQVALLSNSYLKILSFTVFPFMLFQTFRQYSEGLSIVKIPMIIAILANLVNAFMNWVLIYGKLGFPAMKLDGAGYATLANRIFMGISLMLIVLYSNKYKKYNNFSIKYFNVKILMKIIRIGFPSGFQYLFEVAAFSFSAIMVGWINSVSLAAHQIALSLASITYMIILGISSAGNIKVANAFGEKDYQKVKESGFTAILLGIFVMMIFGLFFFLFNNFLPTLFISNPEVITIASELILIAAFFQLFDGAQAVASGVLRGILDVKTPMYVILFSYWLLGIPAGYIFAFKFGMGASGVWLGFLIALGAVATTYILRFRFKTSNLIRNLD